MDKENNSEKKKTGGNLREEAKIGGKLPGRNITEQSEIEQTRVENRREADLEDKTPAGDAGVENNEDDKRPRNDHEEVNY